MVGTLYYQRYLMFICAWICQFLFKDDWYNKGLHFTNNNNNNNNNNNFNLPNLHKLQS